MTKEENKNELITISQVESDAKPTSELVKIVQEMPTVIEKAKKLLKTPANEELDEEVFKETQKELREFNRYHKDIEGAIKNVRKAFDTHKKETENQIRGMLEKAGYDELSELVDEIKNREKMIINNRKNQRWDQLKEHYNNVLNKTYPEIKEKLPNLNFENFQANHDNLISGAKTFKVNDKIYNVVSEHLNQADKDLKAILEMESLYEDKLLQHYEQTLDLSDVFIREKQLKKEEEDIQRRRAEKMKKQQEAIEKENKKKEQIAKLQNKKTTKESKPSTDNIKKLAKIYTCVNNAANQYASDITDEQAKETLNQILEIINND